jgi:hypothetical protein
MKRIAGAKVFVWNMGDPDSVTDPQITPRLSHCFGCVAQRKVLRHRPKRSERCLNYKRLYQSQPALPKLEGVPEGRQRKNHVEHGFEVRFAAH